MEVVDKVIPHCMDCGHYKSEKLSRRGFTHYCKLEERRIDSNYARTSPPWCPDRK